jgi:hypothetical protein
VAAGLVVHVGLEFLELPFQRFVDGAHGLLRFLREALALSFAPLVGNLLDHIADFSDVILGVIVCQHQTTSRGTCGKDIERPLPPRR